MALVTCPECTREVSDHAAACPHCGAPLSRAAATPGHNETKWERCEIVFDSRLSWWLFWRKGYFWAEAIGSKGSYSAASGLKFFLQMSQTSTSGSHRPAVQACNELIKTLVAQGWENTGRGNSWYNYQFRRVQADT